MSVNDRSTPNPSDFPKLGAGVIWYTSEALRAPILLNQHLDPPQRMRLVSDSEIELFAQCDGSSSIETIAKSLNIPAERATQAIIDWEASAPGTFTWAGSPDEQRRRARHRVVAGALYREWEAARDAAGRSDNVRYHAERISDARDQFNRVETTVAHLFSERHKALSGRNYGEALCDKLADLCDLRCGSRILEIGAGTGLLANSFLGRLNHTRPDVYHSVHYTCFDLSPALQASQQTECRAHQSVMSFVEGNIEEHDFGGHRFDVIVANEMIADLTVSAAERSSVAENTPTSEAERQVVRYQLDHSRAQPSFVVNTGGIRLLENLPRWLAPGGTALLTEYGSPDDFPQAVDLPGHREHSVHFGHLVSVAEQLSLNPVLETLGDFLGFDERCAILDQPAAKLVVHYLLPFLGRPRMPLVAYDEDTLRHRLGDITGRIGNLTFLPLSEHQLGPFSFYALVLRSGGR